MKLKHIKNDIKERFHLEAPDVGNIIKEGLHFRQPEVFPKKRLWSLIASVSSSLAIIVIAFIIIIPRMGKDFEDTQKPNSPSNGNEESPSPIITDVFEQIDIYSSLPESFKVYPIENDGANQEIDLFLYYIDSLETELTGMAFIYDVNWNDYVDSGSGFTGIATDNDIFHSLSVNHGNTGYQLKKTDYLYITITKDDIIYKFRVSNATIEVLVENEETVYLVIDREGQNNRFYQYENNVNIGHYKVSYDEETEKIVFNEIPLLPFEVMIGYFN